VPGSPRRRGRRGRRILLWVLALLVIGIFGILAFLFYTDSKIDKIPAEELGSLSAVSGPRNILIVGTDSRENLPEDFEGSFGNFTGSRTDVVMVAHLANGKAQLISIPRDLKVDIPGEGTQKINAAYAFGGPDLLVQTVQNNLGIPINNYMEIDFFGFANTVDALGGITIDFEYPARDLKSGLEVEAGVQTLSGPQALAFARSRSYEEFRDGEWVTVDGTDIGRTGRQQEVLLEMFTQAASPGKAFNLPGFTSTFAEQITADSGMSVGVLAELGRQALGVRGGDIETRTLPVTISNEGGVSYVVPVDPEATTMINAFIAGEPLPETD
jgi:LCP family protein required for cell wall assembly